MTRKFDSSYSLVDDILRNLMKNCAIVYKYLKNLATKKKSMQFRSKKFMNLTERKIYFIWYL